MDHNLENGMLWKLRRIAAGKRQQDIANAIGISTTRYSGIERAQFTPTELERRLLEQALPILVVPTSETTDASNQKRGAR